MTDQNATTSRWDVGFVIILTLVLSVVVWLVSLPFCRFVKRTSLERFHLQTPSFLGWCVQQPIPAMYNFYNTYEIGPSPLDDASEGYWDRGTVNHFPLRLFTFGDNRALFLRQPEPRYIEISSSYRGETVRTRWNAIPRSDGGFDLHGEVQP